MSPSLRRGAAATVRLPGEGETLEVGAGARLTIKAGAAETAGTLFISELTVPAGFPGPFHRHVGLCDLFHVLSQSRMGFRPTGKRELFASLTNSLRWAC